MLFKKLLLTVFILLLVFSLTACKTLVEKETEEGEMKQEELEIPDQQQPEEPASSAGETRMRQTVFYYVNSDGYLVPIMKEIKWVEGIGKAAVRGLIDTDELRDELQAKGLKPSLPAGTQILGMTIRDGLAKVDFNENFLNFEDAQAEKNGVNAVVYTLTEFQTVDRVQIMVNGKILETLNHGTYVGEPLTRKEINLEDGAKGDVAGYSHITLYFASSGADGSFQYFVPVTRCVKPDGNLMKTALEELIKGPCKGKNLYSSIPSDTKLLGIETKEDMAIVNLSKEVMNYGGGITNETTLVKSILLTLTQFPGINSVKITIEGKSGLLPEGTILEQPIIKPVFVNSLNL